MMPDSDGGMFATGVAYCPICEKEMDFCADYGHYFICVNDDCPFLLSEAVQAVVFAMMEGQSFGGGIGALIDACEIALAYTLDEDTTFRIKDRESAGWYVKKIAKIEATKADINREADARVRELVAEIDAINTRRYESLKAPERDLLYHTTRYEPELQEWLEAELKGSKTKSVRISYGVVGTRKKQPKNTVIDELDTVVFAEEVQDPEDVPMVNVKKTIAKHLFFDGWLAQHTDHPRVRVTENGVIELLENNPFLADGEEPAVIACIEPARDELYVKASLPVTGVSA
jgi:hypothetical protein